MTMTKEYKNITKLKGDSVKSVTAKQVNPNVSPSVEDVKTADGDHNLSFSIPRAQRISGMTVTNGDQNNVTVHDDSNGDAVIAMTLKSSSDVNVISPTHVQTAANSSNNDSIAIGDAASAVNCEGSVSIGDHASILNCHASIAIGKSASVQKGKDELDGSGAIAIGNNAVSRESDIVIGQAAKSLELEPGRTSLSDPSIAIGNSARVKGINDVAIGNSSSIKGDSSIAIGRKSVTGTKNEDTNYSIAIGDSASAMGGNSVSIGSNAGVEGINDVAIGNRASVAATKTNDVGRVALGHHSVANREFEVSVGNKGRGIYRNITNVLPPILDSDVATKAYADNVAYGSRLLSPFSFDFKQIESSPYSPTCMPTCHVNTDESTRYLYPYKVKLDKVSTEPFAACLMLPSMKQTANIQVQIKTGTHLTIPNGTKIAVKIYGIAPTTLQPVEGISYEEDFEFAEDGLRAIITKNRYVNLHPSAISISFKTTDGIVLNDATADYDMLLNLFSLSLEYGFSNFTMTLTKDVTVEANKTYQTNNFSIESDNLGDVPIEFFQSAGIVDIDAEKMTVSWFKDTSLAISNFSNIPVTLNAGTKKRVVLYGPITPFDTSLNDSYSII